MLYSWDVLLCCLRILRSDCELLRRTFPELPQRSEKAGNLEPGLIAFVPLKRKGIFFMVLSMEHLAKIRLIHSIMYRLGFQAVPLCSTGQKTAFLRHNLPRSACFFLNFHFGLRPPRMQAAAGVQTSIVWTPALKTFPCLFPDWRGPPVRRPFGAEAGARVRDAGQQPFQALII